MSKRGDNNKVHFYHCFLFEVRKIIVKSTIMSMLEIFIIMLLMQFMSSLCTIWKKEGTIIELFVFICKTLTLQHYKTVWVDNFSSLSLPQSQIRSQTCWTLVTLVFTLNLRLFACDGLWCFYVSLYFFYTQVTVAKEISQIIWIFNVYYVQNK